MPNRPTRTVEQKIEALADACAALLADRHATLTSMSRSTDIPERRLASVLGQDLLEVVRLHAKRPRTGGSRRWTDKQMVEALQEAAVTLDGDVREARYRRLANRTGSRAPSSQTIIRRFRTWNAALEAAGISAVAPLRDYDLWDESRCSEAVARFIRETGSTSGTSYRTWAQGRDDVPAISTIERLLNWPQVRDRALELLGEPRSVDDYVVMIERMRAQRERELHGPGYMMQPGPRLDAVMRYASRSPGAEG